MYIEGCIVVYYFFFFSSRRRHTRLQGDWSSDVCSSDLKYRAPFDRIAWDPPQGEMRASRSDQTWWARLSLASRPNRRDCSPSFDLLAAPPRDNVCFDLFALFGAVQTPFTTSTARLLLNYPAQSSKRDTERSGYLFLVKKMIYLGVNEPGAAMAWLLLPCSLPALVAPRRDSDRAPQPL